MKIKNAQHAIERVDQINYKIQMLVDERTELLEYLSGVEHEIKMCMNNVFVLV